MFYYSPFCPNMQKLPYFNGSLLKNKHGDPLFLFHFCSLHIVTHTWAKFGKKSECRFYFRGKTLRDCRVEKLATTRENHSYIEYSRGRRNHAGWRVKSQFNSVKSSWKLKS